MHMHYMLQGGFNPCLAADADLYFFLVNPGHVENPADQN